MGHGPGGLIHHIYISTQGMGRQVQVCGSQPVENVMLHLRQACSPGRFPPDVVDADFCNFTLSC